MLTTTLALLVSFSGPMQGTPAQAGSDQIQLVRADSAHTLFTPNAADPGRSGQIYQLPQGGIGVTTGGTSHYQTLVMPGGGSGVAVPNGGNSYSFMGSGGRAGTGNIPN
jgi:hypothetical protein